ncbi:MAG: hypothetical protein HFI87_07535 [Bacilli bacterium]|nr:hypothetical protein [Bacilli bacterium]
MIIKCLILIIFNLVYSLNNYNGMGNLIIINTILFLFDILICRLKTKFSLKKFLLSSIITIFLIIINKDIFIYGYRDATISITNLDNKFVEINSLYFNNSKYRFSNESYLDNNVYDIYNKITPNYKLFLVDNYILKTNKAKKIKINFEKYNYDYKLLINNEVVSVFKSVIDNNSRYYKIYDNYYSYEFDNINYDNNWWFLNFVVCFLGLNIIVFIFIDSLISKKTNSLFLILSLFIFEYNSSLLFSISTKLFIYIFSILISFIIDKLKISLLQDMKKFCLILLSSLIATFCLIGSISLDNLSFSYIIIFGFTLWWLGYIIVLFNYFIIYISKRMVVVNNKSFLDRLLLCVIPLVFFFIYLYIFSPYICTTDGSMQLREIKSNILTNWHPFFHTLLMRFSYNVFGNFRSFIIVRIVLVSILFSSIGTYFIRKGINRIFIYLLVFFLSLNPITGIHMVSILKDVDYIICVILLTFLLIKYINKDFKLLDYLLLFISLLFIALFRHNGLYVSIGFILVLFILVIINKNIRFIPICLLIPISLFVINNVVYNHFSIQPGLRNSDIITLTHGLQAVFREHDDNNIQSLLDEYIDLVELNDSYNKYNIDVLLHYATKPFRSLEINKFSLIKLYINELFKYPNILLKDRLFGTDIMWNIVKNDEIQTFDYQIDEDQFGFSYYNEKDIELHDSALKRMITKILLFISNNKILNMIFLRSGLYLCLLLILFINFFDKKNWLILCPFIINIMTLFIALHHQSYRYVMFIPLIFIIYFLQVILNNNKG